MRKPRIYVDTSVIGGCFDPEFAEDSLRFMQRVEEGIFHLLTSDTVEAELVGAPERVKALYRSISPKHLTYLPFSEEAHLLSEAYLAARIVPGHSRDDAYHVAAATVHKADAIVSWNFKHIVQFGRMKAYNQVNLERGYGLISIVSPKELGHETP